MFVGLPGLWTRLGAGVIPECPHGVRIWGGRVSGGPPPGSGAVGRIKASWLGAPAFCSSVLAFEPGLLLGPDAGAAAWGPDMGTVNPPSPTT